MYVPRDDEYDFKLDNIRKKLVQKGLLYFAIIMPLSLFISLLRILHHGWNNIYILHCVTTILLAFVLIFRKKLSYKSIAGIILSVIFILGTVGIFVFGLMGGGVLLLVFFSLMTAIIYGKKASIYACLLSSTIVIIAGVLICSGYYKSPVDPNSYATSTSAWLIIIIVILLLLPAIVFSLSTIYQSLFESHKMLMESNNEHKRLVDNLLDTFLLQYKTDGTVIYISDSVTKVLGYTKDEVLNHHYYDFYTEHPINQVAIENIKKISAGNILADPIECQVRNKNGEKCWLLASTTPVFDENHEVIIIEGVVHNITSRKVNEEELKSLRSYLSSIIDSMPSVLIGVDENCCITRWNKRAEEFMAVDSSSANGQFVTNVFPPIVTEMDIIRKSLETRCVQSKRNKAVKEDKGTTYLNITVYPLEQEDTNGAVIRIDNVTQEYELNEQLSHSRKMDAIGQLAGGVAHDFNNILAGILGCSNLLRKRFDKSEKESKYLDMMERSVMRAADLTSKLLAFGRRGKIHSTAIDMNKVVDDTILILERTIDKRIKLTVNKNAKNSFITGDGSEIQNAFMNIGINASHAMPDGGVFEIETENIELNQAYCDASTFELFPGEYIKITLRDTGCGIPFENQKKIFEPFFTTKESGKGTGLGLAAVYGTVQDHHGAITVYSEPDVGTIFHIILPCSESKIEEETPRKLESAACGTILLVDDEELIRITGQLFLDEMGYDVLMASNGREALKIFQEKHDIIDLTIMDMIMPEMNGREAFLKMKEIDKDCKVILSSGFTKNEKISSLINDGLAGFINKPYKDYELSQLISKILPQKNEA